MKKNILYILAGLVLTAVIVFFFFRNNEVVEDFRPAEFAFSDNLAVKYDQTISVSIDVRDVSDIESIQVLVADSLVSTFTKIQSKLNVEINTQPLLVGAKSLDLVVKMKNGEEFIDNRILRVLSNLKTENWKLNIVQEYPHNTTHFTQGLEFLDNQLYESTGKEGTSYIYKINPGELTPQTKIGLDATYFGEGITILNNTIYQLTWTTGKCFTYNAATLEIQQKEFTYKGEGWGLCNDGKRIFMSDGTERITIRNPETFSVEKTIEVYDENGPVINLNELEYVDGYIYANIWMTAMVAIIEPATGRVVAQINATELVQRGRGQFGDVLNGIAYNRIENKLFMTGKNFNKLFEVTLTKPVI